MKRVFILLGVVFAIAGLAVASLPVLLSSQAVRERITAHISGITGQKVSFRGDPSVSFNPFLGIEISDLDINGTDDEPFLSIERVRGKLKLFSALSGNIELHDFQLLRPRLNLKKEGSGTANWYLKAGDLRKAFDTTLATIKSLDANEAFAAQLGSYKIEDGVVEYMDEIDGSTETITNINARVNWADTSSPLTIQGTAVLRNENLSVEFLSNSPMHLFAGGESDVSLNFSSEPFEFEFDGKANTISDLFAKGALRASTPSIVRLSDFLKFDFGETNAIIGKWEASGTFEGTANMALLSEAEIAIGNNQANGVVGLSRTETGEAKLDGTLAFDEIDLSNYLQSNIDSVNDSVRTGDQNNVDLDLRISANSMIAGNLRFDNVAASITSGDEGWKFDIGNATAFGGSIVASLGSVTENENTQLILKLSSKDTDLGALGVLAGRESPVLSGTTDLKADLRTPLPIPNLETIPVNGEISLNSTAGTIHGIDFGNLFTVANQTIEAPPRYLDAEGQTDFEEMSINMFLSNSRATISKASIRTNEKSIQLHGDADILKGSLALSAQQVSEEGPVSDRLIIGGTFTNPLVSFKPAPRKSDSGEGKPAIGDDKSNSSASH